MIKIRYAGWLIDYIPSVLSSRREHRVVGTLTDRPTFSPGNKPASSSIYSVAADVAASQKESDMLTKNKLAIVAVLVGLASSVMTAQAQTVADQNQTVVDQQGWRFWNGSWDNTCFRTLNYLDSASACSGAAGG
jgi:hypothetical protein